MTAIEIIKKYWKEILLALLVVAGALSYQAYRNKSGQLANAQTELRNSQVEFKTLQDGVTQAKNEMVKSQAELMAQLSDSFQRQLKEEHQKILASVQGKMDVGFKDVKDRIGQVDPNNPKVFDYSDTTMKYIKVNTVDPAAPKFSYGINPISVTFEGTLNYESKNGVASFWVRPAVSNNPDVEVQTSKLVLTPSKEMNALLTSLGTGKAFVPVMPKWTVSGLAGREFLKEIPNGYRNVYGADLTRNFSNNLGVGGGILGSTTYLKLSYSWGK